jgi:hypothetical protein
MGSMHSSVSFFTPEPRDATLKAMKEAEVGWQRAVDKIGERASPCAWTAQGSN